MYSIENPVGRLITVRMASPLSDDEVTGTVQLLRMSILAQAERVVIAGDLRRLEVLKPDWTKTFTALFTRDNPKVDRSSFLVAQKLSSFTMQLERMLREANHPSRKVFDNPADANAFLEPVLTVVERAALRTFHAAV